MIPLRDSIPSRSVPVVTRALILINVVVFFFELAIPPEAREQVFYLFGLIPARFFNHEWATQVGFPTGGFWVLLTHQFLHGGWLHIIFNMWALWIFGDNVEDAMGHLRFALFYLGGGVIAGLTQMVTQPDSTLPSIGASGAIASVLGAYLVLYPRARIVVLLPILFFPFFFEVPAVVYLGIWFVSQLSSGVLTLGGPSDVGGIAFWAHIGGFVAGLVLGPVFARRQRRLQPDEYGLEWAWRE